MNEIKEFRGKYFFLSNFFETPVTWQGITYQNNEAAFQSAKVNSAYKSLCINELCFRNQRNSNYF